MIATTPSARIALDAAPFTHETPSCSTRISVRSALERFGREAVRGVCDTGRYRCPYYLWGNGPALVFIPGMADDSLSFVMPISRLAEHFCCIAYDHPSGQGDGARLGSRRHGDYLEDLRALLDHLGVRRAWLYGSSFGSTITLRALARHPDRFPRGILQGGFARRPLAPAEVLLASFARYWPGNLAHLPWRVATLTRTQASAFAGRDPDAWHYFLERSGVQPLRGVAHRALLIHRLDLRPLLPAVQQPVLLVCGERDSLVGKPCEAELLRGLPQVARAEIEGCGHLPQFSHPEVLAELVGRYLGERPAECAPPALS